MTYFLAIKISKTKSSFKRKKYLWTGIIITFSILFTFKYFNFFSTSVLYNFFKIISIEYEPWVLNILLPIGISFYTFQTIGYLIDVYNSKIKPEKHFGIYALYVSFFPQLVAGPIERAKNLLPQFKKKHLFSYDAFVSGCKIIIVGFFMKLVIADNLAIILDYGFEKIFAFYGLQYLVLGYLFAFQIFCDFAGYSLIAIGTARIMGYKLMTNFDRPYFSSSVSEFWKRWHISLSSWFKDYIYIPLGGNRVGVRRWVFNILIVFIVSGLWHGANTTFLIWGILHAIYIILEKVLAPILRDLNNFTKEIKVEKLYLVFKIFFVFNLVSFAWLFFRVDSITNLKLILSRIFVDGFFSSYTLVGTILWTYKTEIKFLTFLIISLLIVEYVRKNENIMKKLKKYNSIWTQSFIYVLLIIMILTFGVFDNTQFIYFQF